MHTITIGSLPQYTQTHNLTGYDKGKADRTAYGLDNTTPITITIASHINTVASSYWLGLLDDRYNTTTSIEEILTPNFIFSGNNDHAKQFIAAMQRLCNRNKQRNENTDPNTLPKGSMARTILLASIILIAGIIIGQFTLNTSAKTDALEGVIGKATVDPINNNASPTDVEPLLSVHTESPDSNTAQIAAYSAVATFVKHPDRDITTTRMDNLSPTSKTFYLTAKTTSGTKNYVITVDYVDVTHTWVVSRCHMI